MKNLICILLIAVMMLGLASCQGSEPENRTLATEGAEETEGVTESDISSEAGHETTAETATQANTESETASETETDTEIETETETEEEDDMISPADGEKIVLANDEVYGWWSSYNYGKTDSNPFYRHEDIYYPKALTFTWKEVEGAAYYKLYLSTSEAFEADKTESYLVNTNSITLKHLFTGTKYYWKVDAAKLGEDNAEIKEAAVELRSFRTADSPRCLEIEGVSNTRDIGGIAAAKGYRIKQGMIYRGGKLNDMTEAGKEFFLNYVGVKTDLDLRTPGEGGAGSGSPLGSDINYVNINGRYYTGGMGISSEEGKSVFAQEIRLFANKDNYPIYIHCSLGRDRTGTLAFVLEALLGVNKNMLIMDYELSVFSVTGTLDNAGVAAIKNNILATYDYINGFEGKTFADKTENYLLSIGITAEEIQTIRDLLLEEVN